MVMSWKMAELEAPTTGLPTKIIIELAKTITNQLFQNSGIESNACSRQGSAW